MRYLSIVIGLVVLAATRFAVTSIYFLIVFPVGKPAPHLLSDIDVGLLCGLLAMPIAFLLFSRKWPRIVACTAVCCAIGAVLWLFAAVKVHLPSNMILTSGLLVVFTWLICGSLAAYITVAISEALTVKRLAR